MFQNLRGAVVFTLFIATFYSAQGARCWGATEKSDTAGEVPEMFWELPELTVTAGTAWRFAEVEGFQILSYASDKAAAGFMAEFLHELNLGRVMLPGDLLPRPSSPAILILHSGSEPGESNKGWTGAALSDRTDFDQTVFVVNVDWFESTRIDPRKTESFRLSTTWNYLEWLMECRQPRLPRWFSDGLRVLMATRSFGRNEVVLYSNTIRFERSEPGEREEKGSTIASTAIPLERFFSEPIPTEAKAIAVWKRQAWELTLWGLSDDEHRQHFLEFVARASLEGPSPKLFEDCLGMTPREGDRAILLAVKAAVARKVYDPLPLSARAAKGRSEPDAVPFRPAKSSEIARSIGEWRRQNAMLLKDAEARTKALKNVHKVMASHVRKDRPVDHSLLANLALCELSLGDTDAARANLEKACSDKSVRARAWLELARLNYAAAKNSPQGAEGKLSAAQVEEVAEPLRVALGKVPVSIGAYGLWVELWRNSEVTPAEADIALLLKGRELFPAKQPPPQSASINATKKD